MFVAVRKMHMCVENCKAYNGCHKMNQAVYSVCKILVARSNKRHSQETYVGCLVLFKVEHLSSAGGNIIGSRFLEEFCLVHIKGLKVLFIF